MPATAPRGLNQRARRVKGRRTNGLG